MGLKAPNTHKWRVHPWSHGSWDAPSTRYGICRHYSSKRYAALNVKTRFFDESKFFMS